MSEKSNRLQIYLPTCYVLIKTPTCSFLTYLRIKMKFFLSLSLSLFIYLIFTTFCCSLFQIFVLLSYNLPFCLKIVIIGQIKNYVWAYTHCERISRLKLSILSLRREKITIDAICNKNCESIVRLSFR